MDIFINVESLSTDFKSGILELIDCGEYAIFAKKKQDLIEVKFESNSKNGFKIEGSISDCIIVNYADLADAYRAIAYILGRKNEFSLPYSEESAFEFRCVQIEASRNGVMTVDNVKAFLRRFALMGINAACLYTEDTYEVPEEPFLGYLRGKYTQKEFKILDDYAVDLGIELFPCIQTLGHLQQILQWGDAYKDVTDTGHILLVGEEKTYSLLQKMISSISSCFRSKRIHIGMDEAHGLGTGEYKKRNGERSSFDIINEHLKEVVSICKKMDLNPMIWSDMYFRLGSKTNDYYDLNAEIPQNVIDEISPDIDLVYWDYYHKDEDFYNTFIEKHRAMNKEPIVAPAAWTWGRLWTALPFSYDTISPCLKSCRKKNISEVFLTTWGDNGMEVDIYSALPAIQYFSELCYLENVDRTSFAENLMASSGINLEAYEKASDLDSCAKLVDDISTNSNISKWLLWDDPIIGLCEPQQQGKSFKKYYADLARELYKYTSIDTPQNQRLEFPAQIAKVLSLKCDIRKNLVKAYKAKDKELLDKLLEEELAPLLNETRLLWKIHRKMWLSTYKPFGLEVIEIRYGGLMARLESLIDYIDDFISGEIDLIPEFETELLAFDKGSPESLSSINGYSRIATPSAVF